MEEKKIAASILVMGLEKSVEIIFVPGFEDLAVYHLEYAIKYIPALANYLGIAPAGSTFRITQLTDNSIARNDGNTVLIPLDWPTPKVPTGHPLLYHEIGHWWFGQNPRWISEGVSSFLPIAVEKAGLVSFTKSELEAIYNWWGFYIPKIQGDIALSDDELKEIAHDVGFPVNYQKSFKIQYILFNELGKDKYKAFLRSLLDNERTDEHWVLKVEEYANTSGILTALKNQKNLDWSKLLSGWIITKEYNGISIKEWNDTDNDGLLDIEEKYLGTNKKSSDTDGDGLSDSTEIEIGTNPLKKQSREEVRKLVIEKGPFLDGYANDWEFLSGKKTFTSQSVSGLQGRFNLVEFQYIIKNNMLYGMLRTQEKPFFDDLPENEIYFFFSDTSQNSKREGFGMWYSPSARIGWELIKDTPPSNPVGKLGEVFEFKIRMLENSSKPLRLTPIIRNGKKDTNLGIWDNYKPIIIE